MWPAAKRARWCDADSGSTIDVTNPATGEVLGTIPKMGADETRRAIEAVDWDRVWPRFGYPNDLIGALALAGLRIAEVPVRPVYRGEAIKRTA